MVASKAHEEKVQPQMPVCKEVKEMTYSPSFLGNSLENARKGKKRSSDNEIEKVTAKLSRATLK
jgi:hypothetical protein